MPVHPLQGEADDGALKRIHLAERLVHVSRIKHKRFQLETFVASGLRRLDLGQLKSARSHHIRRVLEKISYVGLYFLRSSSITVCWRSLT